MGQPHNHLVERMHEFQHSIFAEMTRLAISTDSLNLGQGFPDYDGPLDVLDAAIAAHAAPATAVPPSAAI